MDNKQTLTVRQATLWLSLHYTGSAILIAPAALSAVAKQDAWISVLVALGLHFALLLVFAPLGKLSGRDSIGTFLNRLLGKPMGKTALALLLLTGPLPIVFFNVRDLTDFTSTDILNQTPVEAIAFVALSTVLFGLFLGIKTIGRAAEVLFPVVAVLMIVMLLSQLPDIKAFDILPVGEYGVKPILAASLLLFGYPYLEPSIPWMVCSKMENPAKFGQALRISALISGLFFFFTTMLTIMRAGPELSAQLAFPTFFMAKMISIGDFYQRVEALLSLLFFIMIFFRLSLLFYACATALSELFSLRDPRILFIPVALVAIPMSSNVWANPGQLFRIDQTWPYFRLIFGCLLPLVLLLIALRKNKKTRSSA